MEHGRQDGANCKILTLTEVIFRGTLLGATSFMGSICNPYGPDRVPGVWARVTAVMDWIVMNTKGEKPPPKNSKCEDIYKEDYYYLVDGALIRYP